MIDKYLKAKHWQIFLAILVLPFTLHMIFMPLTLSEDDPTLAMKIMPIISVVFMAGFFGWFWSIAVGLQSRIPKEIRMNAKRFKAFLFIPVIYIFLTFTVLDSMIFEPIENGAEPEGHVIGWMMAIIVPLHIFSMYCIFYSLYFVAKTFKTVELQREVSFSDFAGEFFMIWFFPIGVWVIQPKLNKMIE
jgi:hypothetical protein